MDLFNNVFLTTISPSEDRPFLYHATPEQNLCIPIATSFVVRLSMSKFGFTSLNSIIFVLASDAAYLTSWINSLARRPTGEGAEVPGASFAWTASMSKPKNVFIDELLP